ncbi:ABC transporter ATP-binding protein [Actinomycetaceae bacterium TAE3-ERU4]|nr:ABC transporter ATP-binding protein [Actinomycetaceae bacterium TAE3-ERU4]
MSEMNEATPQVKSVASIDNLEVAFATDMGSVQAVRGITLDVRPREVLAVVGESGSGKSVTAKTLLGMLPSTATVQGTVVVGKDSNHTITVTSASQADLRSMRGADVSMVFQEPSTALNPVYTIGWQMAEIYQAHRNQLIERGWTKEDFTKKAIRERSIDLLERVGIPDAHERIDYYAHQFSGGQKQRIIIAMALALDPGLIIADEPTTALDVTVQAEILQLLRNCRDEFGASVVLITHNMGVVADLADRVAVMYRGELVEQAEAHELFANPKAQYTRDLLAAVPKIGERDKVDPRQAHAERESGSVDESLSAVAASFQVNEITDGTHGLMEPEEGDTKDPRFLGRPVAVRARDMQVRYEGRFGKRGFLAVKDADFTIHAGEVVGLVGESGSGKTTTARAVAGLTRVTGGSLNVLGCEMKEAKERDFRPIRSRIGYVFQDPAASFNPLLTIGECIAEPLIIHGHVNDVRAARPRVNELLDAVELASTYADRYPHELSGGQRQRASLARALALGPELLIADEPTSALDVSVQATVLDLFLELQAQFGFACLFISHDLAVVDEVSHSIFVMYKGEIVEQGVARDVLQGPKHPYTQRLLAALPVPDPVKQAKRREMFNQLPAFEL